MNKLISALCVLAAFVLPAYAQKTPSAILTEIAASTANGLRGGTILNDITNSFLSLTDGGTVNGSLLIAGNSLSVGSTNPSGISSGALRISSTGLNIVGVNENLSFTGTATGATVAFGELLNVEDTANYAANGVQSFTYRAIQALIGNNSLIGNRVSSSSAITLTGQSGNKAAGINAAYVGFSTTAQATVNDGGTSGSPNAWGIVQGMFSQAALSGTATFYNEVNGAEFDVSICSTCSALFKYGIQIVELGSDVTHASNNEAAIHIANQTGAVGWNYGIQFNATGGIPSPIASTGTAIFANGAQTWTGGVDFSSATITGNFLAGPNGFAVSGAGNVTANGYQSGASPGVTCNAGFSATTGRSVNGLVTHC